ncbi:MAG: isochorismate synthase [Acidimicrobiales bacterium]
MISDRLTCEARALDQEVFALLRAEASAEHTLFERPGCSVLAFGKAQVLRLPLGLRDPAALQQVQHRLTSIASASSSPTELPLVIGALPFLPGAPGHLTIPSVTVVRDPAGIRAVTVAEAGCHTSLVDGLLRARRESAAPGLPPDGFSLHSARSHADFLDRVDLAISEVRSGRLDKVVLAREVLVNANRPFLQGDLIERLRSLHPSCTTFCVDGFLGATPELLIRRSGRSLSSDPLAGTAPRSGDPEVDQQIAQDLLSSAKERQEHRAVVDSIAAALAPVVASLDLPDHPEIVGLRNVSHLRTPIRGQLAEHPDTGHVLTALETLALIHPTPAVAGSPVDIALEYLEKSEGLDRGHYGGPIGWMRADGDGEFHLGIRSAIVEGSSAHLWAGVGIVGDSEPMTELRETQLKLQALLAALVRP